MKSCIVYKCIKPEGSDGDSHYDGQEQASYKEALEGRDKKTVTAPHIYLTVEMEPRFQNASTDLWLSFLPQIQIIWKNGKWNVSCERDVTLPESLANVLMGKMSLENTILYFAWVSQQQDHLLLLKRLFCNFSLSFNNSKYFKRAVKYTVTISSIIVSHEEKYFLKLTPVIICVCIYIFKKQLNT